MRTVPTIGSPPAGVTVTRAPGLIWPMSDDGTSARHSSRPWRIIRNSSWPAGSTAPTVALRDEITPSSGASTAVCETLSWRACRPARCASRRARAVRSAVRYWLIVASLSAPVASRLFARCALALASASVASASATAARICSRSACIVSGREGRERLAALDDVADVDLDVGQAQAVRLGADARFLPGGDVAVGARRQRAASPAAAGRRRRSAPAWPVSPPSCRRRHGRAASTPPPRWRRRGRQPAAIRERRDESFMAWRRCLAKWMPCRASAASVQPPPSAR